jgi:heme/copper-type cytochrome/quinol oxidase subunit 3
MIKLPISYLRHLKDVAKDDINEYQIYTYSSFIFESFLLLLFKNKIEKKKKYVIFNDSNKLFSNRPLNYYWNPYSIYNNISWIYKNSNFNIQIHNYHLVNQSSLPLLASLAALIFLFGLVLYMHNYKLGSFTIKYGLYFLILISAYWWRDVIMEGLNKGYHTVAVKQGLRLGMVLFIVSEVMFFFSFFWAFFHSSLNPGIALGSMWPPAGINPIDPMKIPLLNTLILLVSGIFLTWSHSVIKQEWWFNEYRDKILLDYYYFYPFKKNNYSDINNLQFDNIANSVRNNYNLRFVIRNSFISNLKNSFKTLPINFIFHIYLLKDMYLLRRFTFINAFYNINWTNKLTVNFMDGYYMFEAIFSLTMTILLGLEFTWWQYYEYYNATFYIFDGVYGSTFYMTTGLHGLHVLIGTLFLIVCLFRLYNFEFIWKSHIGYECAIWYWHFVDVVWIIVFSVIYCWGAGFDNFFKSFSL